MQSPVREQVEVQLLGPLTAVVGGQRIAGRALGSRKARTVLGLLAAMGDVHVPADRLVDAAWPDRPPARPGAELAILVSRLRSTLGTDSISGGRAAYRLDRRLVSVDLDDASRLVSDAESRVAEPALAIAAATGALAVLDRGEVVDDDPYAAWADEVRDRVTVLRRRARLAVSAGALATHDPVAARRMAELALSADPLDEEACRLLMRAAAALGEDAVALAAYEQLRSALSEALGADPSAASRDLHLSILQSHPLVEAREATAPAPLQTTLVGRDPELAALAAAWAAAAAGSAGLVLVCGEPGIGKTTLAHEVRRLAAGALVLEARCFEAERSLFLQPVVEAIGGCVSGLPAAVLNDVVVERADVLASLVPAVAAVRPAAHPAGFASPDAGRRQAYDAVTGFLRRLSRQQPLVLLLDDLHNVGLATVDLLHYLVRTLSGSALLIVATVRHDEGAEAIARLSGVSTVLNLEPFDDEAVTALVTAVGQQEHLAAILDSTSGHPLFVVETLNALATGEAGIPLSLQDSVLARVAKQGREAEALLRVAAVLGPTFGPADLVAMTGESLAVVTRVCEDALRSRLLSVSERSYAFSYDVTREVLYRTTPDPSRTAYHLLAADVLSGRPEAVAHHTAAAGQTERAAQAWLLAGEQALARFAVSDAERLLDLAIDAAQEVGKPALVGRCHIARGRAREAMLAWTDALSDYERTVVLARAAGDERLEMVAEVELGGDSRTGVGRPVTECMRHMTRARSLADRLGDRPFEAMIVSRLAILGANDLDFVRAVELGTAGVALGRAAQDDVALAAGLDGLKTAHAYLGDVVALSPVVDELIPLLRRLGDVKRLQWALAEASFVPLASGQWSAAAGLVEEAVALSRSGGSTAYEAWFLTSLGHVARLQGRTADALAHGRRAVATGRGAGAAHAWCEAIAVTTYATTLLRAGRSDEAADLLVSNAGLVPDGLASAYRVRIMAALAEATGEAEPRHEAEALLATATVPAGRAWLLGWDVYASLARAQAAAGDHTRALATVTPLVEVARRTGWTPVIEEATTLLPKLRKG